MARRKKPADSRYLKIPKELWTEVIHLLQEAPEHLDYDFDFTGSNEYERKVTKVVEKVDELRLPVRSY